VATIIDRDNYGPVIRVIDTPVWYSVQSKIPEEVAVEVKRLTAKFNAVQGWLNQVYEYGRAGIDALPPMSDEVKEILDACETHPGTARPASKRKQKDTVADSSSEPQPD